MARYIIISFLLFTLFNISAARLINGPSRSALEEGEHQGHGHSSCEISFDPSFSKADFPSDFQFGAATAAYQIEGAAFEDGRGACIWDVFTTIPGKIVNSDNASVADDSYHKYEEDVKLLRNLGVDTYRFSISWSRILPNGTGEVNPLGIQYYNNLINALLAVNIVPAVTLYHWDLPEALHSSMGGWLNASISDYFVEYADLCFKSFGDRVKTWITFNEPMETAVQGYALGSMAPGRTSDPSVEPYVVAHHILVSHAKAVAVYRSEYLGSQGGRIGITLDSQMYFPANEESAADRAAADTALQYAYGW